MSDKSWADQVAYDAMFAKAKELQSRLESEHENFLAVHRDNMRLADINSDFKKALWEILTPKGCRNFCQSYMGGDCNCHRIIAKEALSQEETVWRSDSKTIGVDFGKGHSETVNIVCMKQETYDELQSFLSKCREALQEVEFPPYPDSDLSSLLETLRFRAKKVISEFPKWSIK